MVHRCGHQAQVVALCGFKMHDSVSEECADYIGRTADDHLTASIGISNVRRSESVPEKSHTCQQKFLACYEVMALLAGLSNAAYSPADTVEDRLSLSFSSSFHFSLSVGLSFLVAD